MTYPTPHTLSVKAMTDGPPNEFGNTTKVASVHTWQVYFVAPGSISETDDGTRDLSKVAYSIGAPSGPDVPGVADLVTIDGTDYKVSGVPANWDRGPFGFAPGVVVEVERADG